MLTLSPLPPSLPPSQSSPDCSLADLEKPCMDEETTHIKLRYMYMPLYSYMYMYEYSIALWQVCCIHVLYVHQYVMVSATSLSHSFSISPYFLYPPSLSLPLPSISPSLPSSLPPLPPSPPPDAYQYQNIFSPLVKLEADYDKALKES